MVITPNMFSLEDSPFFSPGKVGIIELKCPEGRKNHFSQQAIRDESFKLVDGKPHLKKDRHFNNNTQVQVVMGFCRLQWIDFVVYPFKAMNNTRVALDKDYFYHVAPEANTFAKWFLPQAMALIWLSTLCGIAEQDRT